MPDVAEVRSVSQPLGRPDEKTSAPEIKPRSAASAASFMERLQKQDLQTAFAKVGLFSAKETETRQARPGRLIHETPLFVQGNPVGDAADEGR